MSKRVLIPFMLASLVFVLGTLKAVFTETAQPVNAAALPCSFLGMNFNANDVAKLPVVAGCGLRLWDNRVTWENLETANSTYNWGALDAWLAAAAAAHRDVLYTLGRTPRWATAGAPCNYNTWCAGAPLDVDTTDQIWKDFITALATHAKGKIVAYELWNEPNTLKAWAGTMDELVKMSSDAYAIIHAIDPQAIVLSPSATENGTAMPQQWLSLFIARGGAAAYDAVAFHAYFQDANSVLAVTDAMKTLAAGKPVWMTEGSWGLSVPANGTFQVIYVYTYHKNLRAKGVERVYWYAWDNNLWGTLSLSGWPTPGGNAYNELPVSLQ